MLRLCLLIGLLALSSCGMYRDDDTSFVYRDREFSKLLADPKAQADYHAGKTNELAAFLEASLARPEFAKTYRRILDREGIALFSPLQVASFYYSSIYLRIPR